MKSITRHNLIRALRHRNYRLYFAGQGVSLIGTWMQNIAMGWLVYRLTNSPFWLGMFSFTNQIPHFVLAPLAGVLADRWNRRQMLVITQVLLMLQALVLSVLVLTHTVQLWHVLGLSLFAGIVNAFDAPARQSFVVHMIEDKADLGNAIALNSSMFNGARLVGPSIAGILIKLVGEGVCFLINGASYLAVILALLAMKIVPQENNNGKNHLVDELKEGFHYTFTFHPIRTIIINIVLVSMLGMPYMVLMPVFATKILQGGPQTLGFLMASAGMGALCGAFFLAARKNVVGMGKLIPIATVIFSLGLIGFSLSRTLWLSMAILVITGFGMMVQMASSNTLLQTIVDDRKRGRVMSIYTMSFMGIGPFGSLLAGSLANHIGSPATVMIGGFCCIISALIFALNLPAMRKHIFPIYQQMGILPEKEETAPEKKS